jgi:hypothetical protein
MASTQGSQIADYIRFLKLSILGYTGAQIIYSAHVPMGLRIFGCGEEG